MPGCLLPLWDPADNLWFPCLQVQAWFEVPIKLRLEAMKKLRSSAKSFAKEYLAIKYSTIPMLISALHASGCKY